jgi:dihydrodiol dehydrogenase / D-xylose 1-dehydrogenase (NADP)
LRKRKAKWAMWSIGNIARRVVIEMTESDKLDIVAICSSSIEKAQAFIDEYQLTNAMPYDHIDDVLLRDDIDIVYISSPPHLHKDHCCKCLDAGKNVLCEKPLATSAQDAIEIFECAKKNKKFMAEGIWTNYFPAMKKANQWIEEGRIGEVVEVVSTFGIQPPFDIEGALKSPQGTAAWGLNISTGGGAFAQLGCYCVNLAQFVYGKQPENIHGFAETVNVPDGADLNMAAVLSYTGGKQRALISSSFQAITMSKSVISGTLGNIEIGNPFFAPFNLELFNNNGHPFFNESTDQFYDSYVETGREGFKYQFDAVSEYVVEGRTESPEVPYDYSIKLATTMQAIRETVGLENNEVISTLNRR